MLSNGIHIGRRGGVRLTGGDGGGGGGIDSDASALIALMDVAPDSTRQGYINTLVTSLKTAGVWTLLDELWIMAAHDAQAARLGWKRYKNLTAVNSPTFTTDRGYAGIAFSAYLNTNFVPSTDGVQFTQNDASLGVYSRTDGYQSNFEAGVSDGTNRISIMLGNTTSEVGRVQLNQSLNSEVGRLTTPTGLLVIRRTGAAANGALQNGVIVKTQNLASSGLPTKTLFIAAFNNNGSATGQNTRQFAAAFVGAAMSEAQQLSLYNAIQTYMTAVGAQV